MKGAAWRDALRFADTRTSQSKVRRCYAAYRRETGLPDRCDSESCVFFTKPLLWNGQPLPLIVDHVNGVRHDNSPGNLRYLCPNCDSQLPTRGGANKGRVAISSGGYAVKNRDGKTHHTLVADPG